MTAIIDPLSHDAKCTEQFAGLVELPTATWDAVTGEVGGLEIAAIYYLSDVTAGHITKTAPVAMGSYVTQIGIAMSKTIMQLQIMAPVGPHA